MTTTIPSTNRFSDDASKFRKGEYTPDHFAACNILDHNHVLYLSEYVVHAWSFDYRNRPVSFKPDIIIVDPNYGFGIIHIEGKGSRSKDNDTEDAILLKLGFSWIIHLPNDDVTDIMDKLNEHKRVLSEWP